METFTAEQAGELAVVERSGFVESRHIGSAVVVAPDGETVIRIGAPEVPVFVRSCLKPLQALASLELGAPLQGETAAIASASHKAESGHIRIVKDMLRAGELEETDLRCPSVRPADPEYRMLARNHGSEKSPLYYNCSGKHAAFLLAARHNQLSTADYLDPAHPVQQRVAEVAERLCGSTPVHWGVDGCGAPVPAMPLSLLARGISRFSQGCTPDSQRIMDAILAHPWVIDGHKKSNATVIEKLGILAKAGAEGCLVMGTPEGWAVAVKCLDGSGRIGSLVGLQLLIAVGAVPADEALSVLSDLEKPVTGGTLLDGSLRTVGVIRTGYDVISAVQNYSR